MTRAGEEITSRLLTIPEAAHYLRASTNFVRTLLWKHDLKFVKCGKKALHRPRRPGPLDRKK